MAYAGIVVEKSVLRQLQATGNTLIADVAAPNATSRDVLDAAERRLFALAQNRTLRSARKPLFHPRSILFCSNWKVCSVPAV